VLLGRLSPLCVLVMFFGSKEWKYVLWE